MKSLSFILLFVFFTLNAVTGFSQNEQQVEYDDMYFTAVDRKVLEEKKEEEKQLLQEELANSGYAYNQTEATSFNQNDNLNSAIADTLSIDDAWYYDETTNAINNRPGQTVINNYYGGTANYGTPFFDPYFDPYFIPGGVSVNFGYNSFGYNYGFIGNRAGYYDPFWASGWGYNPNWNFNPYWGNPFRLRNAWAYRNGYMNGFNDGFYYSNFYQNDFNQNRNRRYVSTARIQGNTRNTRYTSASNNSDRYVTRNRNVGNERAVSATRNSGSRYASGSDRASSRTAYASRSEVYAGNRLSRTASNSGAVNTRDVSARSTAANPSNSRAGSNASANRSYYNSSRSSRSNSGAYSRPTGNGYSSRGTSSSYGSSGRNDRSSSYGRSSSSSRSSSSVGRSSSSSRSSGSVNRSSGSSRSSGSRSSSSSSRGSRGGR
jgi:hypothetical protein